MNVSLYDLLDVDETASTDEIRAAWKAAIADLDPTDRRFRAFNDAAGVLLDDAKRAAYDAELAAGRDEETAPTPVVAAEEPTAVPVEPTAVPVESVVDDAEAEPEAEVEEDPEPAPVLEEGAKDPAPAATGPSTWLLYLAAGLAVLSAALLVVVLTWPGSLGGDSPASTADQAADA
ncbi:J domain-containing protein, partial [Nocardioides stalactiti]|uniref:J domain-containing protein n=1 Tax=Nocardioides stalactiti TaxID=2755356 RepID=UPI001C7EA4B6